MMNKPFRLLIGVLALTAPSLVMVVEAQTPDQGAPVTAKRQQAESRTKSPKSSNDPLTIEVSPHLASEKGTVFVRTRVQPDSRSRVLNLEWWTADFVGGSHLISLDGERAASRHEYALKGLAAGEYVVTAVLRRNDGTLVRRETRLLVAGANAGADIATLPPQSGDVNRRK